MSADSFRMEIEACFTIAGRGTVIAGEVTHGSVLKSNYYSRASLDRLSKLVSGQDRTEASLLREALS